MAKPSLTDQAIARRRAHSARLYMTRLELSLQRILRDVLRNTGIHYKRQYAVPGTSFFSDFAILQPPLIIEADGPHHGNQRDYDQWRDRIIRSKGFKVIRFTSFEIQQCPAIVAGILHKLIHE